MRWRGQSGQTAAEYLGVLLVVSTLIAALATTGIGDRISGRMQQLICQIAGGECSGPGGSESDATTQEALERRAQELEDWADEQGGRYGELLDDAEAALARGDLEEADRILDLLELYRQLSAGPRGDVFSDLTGSDDAAFRALVEEGNTYQEGGKYNRRYFQIEPAPGEGVLAYDYYIPFESSLFLKGDDRGVADPLLGPYGQDRSRITVIIDRETGRGVVVQTETCTTGIGMNFCNEPKPIVFDKGDDYVNDSENDATGEGINIDKTNEFEFESDDDSVSLDYDALNSITPLGISVDGEIEIVRQPDGTYAKGKDTRDDYPAKVIYHYRPGEEPYGIYDDKDINPDQVDGALPLDPDINSCTPPFADNPFVPDQVPCIGFD
jgi:hypothetical protein